MRDRRVEAQELLQRRRQPFGIVTQQRQLIRVAEQGDDAVADEAGGRVVTGDDQLEDRREQLPGVEALVAVTGGDQGADEVVARCAGSSRRRAARAARRRCRMPAWPRRTAPASRSGRAARSGLDRGRRRSGSGTPSSSQMTVNGSGNAKRETRSTRLSAPSAAMSSSRSSTIVWIRGRSPSMRRGEKALETSRRSRVWSGGSTVSMCRANAGPGRPSDTTAALATRAACMSFDSRGSLSAARASLVVDDEPRIVAVDERHRVHRAAPAHVGEQGERVVAVVGPPRRQRRGHVVLTHRQTISQLRHAPRRVIPRRSGRPSVQSPMWAAYGPESPASAAQNWRIGTEDTPTRPV